MQRCGDFAAALQHAEAVNHVGKVASEGGLPAKAALDGEGQANALPPHRGSQRRVLERLIIVLGEGDRVNKAHGHDREEVVRRRGVRQ